MDKKNFEILSGDTLVALWQNNNLEIINNNLLPLFLKSFSNAESWLESRAIDSHRANSRLLKKALRLTEKDDISTVIHVNAATVTDNYWVRPIGSNLKYEDIRFNDDYFSNLALKGTYDSFNRAANRKNGKTPELTNVGSFEKCWKLKNNKWWMYKKASHDEMFSELFIYELGTALKMNMAVYERADKAVKTLDFTNGAEINFEPASAFMGDNENYSDVIEKLKEICPNAIPQYIQMIFLDTIVSNPDRHTNNFGLLRDTKSGELKCLAPNFDNNMALISRGYPNANIKNDLLISLFNEVINEYPEYKKYIPKLTEDILRNVMSKVNMRVKSKQIIEYIWSRYNSINLS